MKYGKRGHVYLIELSLILSSGIALSRPEASVRVHSTQPLYVAGHCLTHLSERKLVLDLLRSIEKDLGWGLAASLAFFVADTVLGWATEGRVYHLLRQWGWTKNSTPTISEYQVP